jgi:hypothetical protein
LSKIVPAVTDILRPGTGTHPPAALGGFHAEAAATAHGAICDTFPNVGNRGSTPPAGSLRRSLRHPMHNGPVMIALDRAAVGLIEPPASQETWSNHRWADSGPTAVGGNSADGPSSLRVDLRCNAPGGRDSHPKTVEGSKIPCGLPEGVPGKPGAKSTSRSTDAIRSRSLMVSIPAALPRTLRELMDATGVVENVSAWRPGSPGPQRRDRSRACPPRGCGP